MKAWGPPCHFLMDIQNEHISLFHMLKPPVSEAVDGRVIQLGSQIGCVRIPRKLTKHKSHVFDDENQKGGTQQHGWNQGILDIRNNILGAMGETRGAFFWMDDNEVVQTC